MQNTVDPIRSRHRKSRRKRHHSRSVLLLGAVVLTSLYLAGCYIVFQNKQTLEALEKGVFDMSQAETASRRAILHDSFFFREFAERMPYDRHDPNLVMQFYKLAIRKAPSSHEALYSYAYYLSVRNCCGEQVRRLLQETVRRCPTHPKMHSIAATYFMNLNEREKALPFVRKALELAPGSGPELFRMLQQGDTTLDTILEVTPDTPDAQIQLAGFLIGLGDSGKTALQETLAHLNKADLSAQQRLRLAELASRSGDSEMAWRQAELASRDRDAEAEAWAFQVRMLWSQGKKKEASALANKVEDAYREKGTGDQAVRYAMEIASMLRNMKDSTAAKEHMLRILNDYPAYAPAHFQMAQFTRGESEELELFYLRKARDLAPENLEYRRVLARRLLETKRVAEAEAAFSELVHVSGAEKEAFLGLAQCRMQSGDRLGAIRVLEQAQQRDVVTDPMLLQLGRLYASAGEYEKAANAFLKYADRQRGDAEACNLAAEAYLNMGRYRTAREQYRKALERDPNNQRARNALANLDSLGY